MAQVTLQKSYSVINQETGNCILQCNDGGFLIGGKTDLSGYVVKVDGNGDTLWTKIYNAQYFIVASLQSTPDSNYIICGSVFYNSTYFLSVIKMDNFGDTIWTFVYGEPSGSYNGYAVRNTSDSGFIIGGTIHNTGVNRGLFLLKINATGVLQWSKKYNSSDALFDCVSICNNSNDGFLIVGIAHFLTTFQRHVVIINTDNLGDTIWTRCYILNGDNYPSAIHLTNDHGFIVSGYTNGFGGTHTDAFLLKIDSIGNQQWVNKYGSSIDDENSFSLVVTNDNGYLFCGATGNNLGDVDAYVVKTNSSGTMTWATKFGDNTGQEAVDLIQTQDGNTAICGTTDFGAIDIGKVLFARMDSSGNSCNLLLNSIVDSAITFFDTSLTITVAITSAISFNLGFPISSGGLLTTYCFDSGPCASYSVSATASTDSVCQSTIQLNAIASTGNSIYEWTPAVNLSSANIPNPLINYSFNHDFIVTATDTITGCFATDTVFRISAMSDFTETIKTCGSVTWDFFLPAGADSYLWSSYTDSTGTSHPLNDTNNVITTVGAPCTYFGSADLGGCIVNGTYNLLDTCSTTGLNSISSGNIELFPNPANEYLVIKLPGVSRNRIYIADRLGKIVFENQNAESLLLVSTTTFSKGLYIVTIDDGKKIIHKKIQIIN